MKNVKRVMLTEEQILQAIGQWVGTGAGLKKQVPMDIVLTKRDGQLVATVEWEVKPDKKLS